MYRDGGWDFSIARPQSLVFECGVGSSVTGVDISRGLVVQILSVQSKALE
jgi:hypothetical protein